MPENGLSRARRAWMSTAIVAAVLSAAYLCVCYWPVTETTLDPLKTPFYGAFGATPSSR